MTRLLSFLFILIIPQLAKAQDRPIEPKGIIFFSPFKLLDPVNPGVELSYEKAYCQKWATHVAATYVIQITGVDRNVSGYRLQVEQKYFYRTSVKRRQYFSAGLSYGITKLDDKIRYYDWANNITYRDSFSVSRRNTSFNIKWGRQYHAGRFVFDLAVGAGLKYRHVTHKDRSIPHEVPEHYSMIYSANREAKEATFNLPASFKIGYRF